MEFGYARVSTTHQNTDRQIEALLEYGIPERNIIVDKQSGKDFERVGYLALKNTMLRAGDTLVIKELDRLGRNKQMIKEELEWFKAHEIRVKILNVPTSLMECDGQDWILEMVSNILIEVMASIAEEERLKNHQRQSEGIQAAKNRGVVFGRPAVRKPENYEAVMEKVARGDMKAVEAMREMGIKKTTFYKLKKIYGDLFIELGAGGILNVYFKYSDKVHRISSQIHMGMFQDSYLYRLSGVVDFRHYAFVGGSVNTYHMSDSIKRLVVNNIGSRPVTIDNVVYKHGINVTLVTEENHPEGLISPDAFNGKSLLSDFIKEGDSNV